jgi:hypothetical protein
MISRLSPGTRSSVTASWSGSAERLALCDRHFLPLSQSSMPSSLPSDIGSLTAFSAVIVRAK